MTDEQVEWVTPINIDRNRAAELASTVANIIDDLPEDVRYAIREVAESRFKTYREGDAKAAIAACQEWRPISEAPSDGTAFLGGAWLAEDGAWEVIEMVSWKQGGGKHQMFNLNSGNYTELWKSLTHFRLIEGPE